MEEKTENIEKLIKDLKEATLSQNDIEEEKITLITEILDSLVKISKDATEDNTAFLNDNIFLKLLTHNSKLIAAKIAKSIAEIAKTEPGREKCTNEEFVQALIQLLKSQDLELITQTSRALGNICYENVKGTTLIREKDGLKYILKVLAHGVDLAGKEGGEFLRNVVTGLLLNFIVGQCNMKEKVIGKEIVPIICDVLELDGVKNGDAAMQALLILGVLNDSGIQFLDSRLTKIVVEILANNASSEFSEMCLEVLHGQADDENAKMLLAKAGACELLLNLLEKNGPRCTDEETRSVLKVACNLIVLILTGDDSMIFLYKKSEGPVYKKLIEWLESSDEDLQVTAVLAMGNFARADMHCEVMVTQGVHHKLLKLLSKNNSKSGDIRFQHDLLSALRNLVIPHKNKSIVLSDGLIDLLIPMLEIPTFPVVFKLLGTLRIVIDGQQEAAISFGKNDTLLKNAVEWSETEDHPGIQGEASRLLAWLIINSRNKEVVMSVIYHGGIKPLVKMLNAKYALMQNEALLSLNILTAFCLDESEKPLLNYEVGPSLKRFLKESAPTLEPPIIYNCLSLTLNLAKAVMLKEHLKKSEVSSSWKEVLSSRESELENSREKLKNLSFALDFSFD